MRGRCSLDPSSQTASSWSCDFSNRQAQEQPLYVEARSLLHCSYWRKNNKALCFQPCHGFRLEYSHCGDREQCGFAVPICGDAFGICCFVSILLQSPAIILPLCYLIKKKKKGIKMPLLCVFDLFSPEITFLLSPPQVYSYLPVV